MIGIDLYWRRTDDELALGKAYLDALPPIGTLLAYPTAADPLAVWRIDILYVHPAQAGTMLALHAALGGRQGQVATYAAFVSPAEGPHATAPEDR